MKPIAHGDDNHYQLARNINSKKVSYAQSNIHNAKCNRPNRFLFATFMY
ncbi:hypothetical protein YE3094_20912 [Yersinia enterocolitica (type O:2) str. YE3094/96]|nr:hypothetical protein YE3094_20912 [Yersinia enterocolitica (type O:2) str. YE3094/96]